VVKEGGIPGVVARSGCRGFYSTKEPQTLSAAAGRNGLRRKGVKILKFLGEDPPRFRKIALEKRDLRRRKAQFSRLRERGQHALTSERKCKRRRRERTLMKGDQVFRDRPPTKGGRGKTE